MHREIQIKQFPIVTTHWWPKTRNERFVWENKQYLYRFFTSCTQPCPSDLSAHTHPVCVRALWLMLHSHGASASTLDGGCVWSVVLTQLFKRQRRHQPIRSPQITNPVHATPEKYVIGCCNYDGGTTWYCRVRRVPGSTSLLTLEQHCD